MGRLKTSWGVLGVSWGCLGGILGASWGVLRRLGRILGVFEASWGLLWGVLGADLGASWGSLGASWGHLVPDFQPKGWLNVGYDLGYHFVIDFCLVLLPKMDSHIHKVP